MLAGISRIKGGSPSKLTSCEDDLFAWFDHVEEIFSYKEVQLKRFCSHEKTSCPPAADIHDTSALDAATVQNGGKVSTASFR